MRIGLILGIIAIPALLLSGCGHKGPLRLPPPQPSVQPETQQPDTSPDQPEQLP